MRDFFVIGILLIGLGLSFLNSCTKDNGLPVVKTNKIDAIRSFSAVGGGRLISEGTYSVISKGVCWSTVKNKIIYDNVIKSGSGSGDFVCYIPNLNPNTTYYVRAYATNNNGTSFGDVVEFKTYGLFDDPFEETFTDSRDGTIYKTVQIGYQVWMAENLKYLPSVNPPSATSLNDTYYYVYGYDGTSVSEAKATTNYRTYGVLYNWPAAIAGGLSSSENPSGVRGICPKGWHLPSEEEWKDLLSFVDDDMNDAYMLKSKTGWSNSSGSDEFGFSALPGGERNGMFNNFKNLNSSGTWWSSTAFVTNSIWTLSMESGYRYTSRRSARSDYGYSVRCVKND